MKTVATISDADLTPEVMAQAFWEMDSIQQAAFFSALAKEVKKTPSAYSYGEMQWCILQDELKKDPEAMRMYMSLSAFAFDYWPNKAEHEMLWGEA